VTHKISDRKGQTIGLGQLHNLVHDRPLKDLGRVRAETRVKQQDDRILMQVCSTIGRNGTFALKDKVINDHFLLAIVQNWSHPAGKLDRPIYQDICVSHKYRVEGFPENNLRTPCTPLCEASEGKDRCNAQIGSQMMHCIYSFYSQFSHRSVYGIRPKGFLLVLSICHF